MGYSQDTGISLNVWGEKNPEVLLMSLKDKF